MAVSYTQAALVLEAVAHAELGSALLTSSGDGWVATLRHTPTPSNRQHPGDLWGEYRMECEARERLHLPPVSLIEFRDMCDWSDQTEEDDDDNWITEPPDPPPYGCMRAW
jgi:hypothetical protein